MQKVFRYKGCGRGFSSEERFAVQGPLGFWRLMNRAGLVLTNMGSCLRLILTVLPKRGF